MTSTTAFEPVRLGSWDLPQRFVMAPLTRNRAGAGEAPTALNVEYYAQRATAGLVITEGTQPSAVGQGYAATPGIHTPEQVEGWRAVADAVHARGGRLVVQLMHAGRIAHPDNKGGLESVSASAVQAAGEIVTPSGQQPYAVPRALETSELAGVIGEYVHAARSAVEAGADGVELHAANGYLLHQFLAPNTNQRTDEYGGTPAKRARFVIEVARAVADAIGSERVGMRVSPGNPFNDIAETDPAATRETYLALLDGIAPLELAYLSILGDPTDDLVVELRSRFGGSVILNTGFGEMTDLEQVESLLGSGIADAVAVGRGFLANPDLPTRWRTGAELNAPDYATFYGGGAKGYTDYPTLQG